MRYDAVIIGGGPGGYECALWIHKLGGKAAVVEKSELGGVCTNRGCIPTKALAASCEAVEAVRKAAQHGIEANNVKTDVGKMLKRRDRVALTLRKGIEKILEETGVEIVKGDARVKSANEVEAGGMTLECENIVLASGSKPTGLPGLELDGEYIISGDDAATSNEFTEDIVVVGGGFIGCEYAAIYGKLGCNVTLVEALPRILAAEDSEISKELESILSKDVRIVKDVKVESADRDSKTVKVGGEDIKADRILLAVGRKPNIPEGVGELGVEVGEDGVKVNPRMETSVKGVYAVGDVTGGSYKLAHVAYAGAETAAKNIMGLDDEVDYDAVPWCVFTLPEIGRVGVTEDEAGSGCKVGRADYISNGKARCMGERSGFCKVVVDGEGVIVGVHMIGAHASDLIGEASLAVKMKLKASDVAATIHPHPTLTEIFKEACRKAVNQ
ncbi:MAG: dihydrolipoyl dehydrogenase [Candidatus Altiarchaeales archaeon]|nr:dihydrolipoyl dehydrogenase [Candidatus Altiarchaeales archaeon]MBD3416004.1 dihydrolipoyl dehydrogenase [Candidatus Altiarchaeales archaeon]